MKKTPSYRNMEWSRKLYGWIFAGVCLLIIIAWTVYSVSLRQEMKATEREIAEIDKKLDSIRQELGKRKGHTPRYFKMGPAYFRTPEATREIFGDKKE